MKKILILIFALSCSVLFVGCATVSRQNAGVDVVHDIVAEPVLEVLDDKPAIGFLDEKKDMGEDVVAVPKFDMWRSVGVLAVLMGCLFVLHGYVKKRQGMMFSGKNSKKINLIENMLVGNRQNILLMEVDGERVLVGMSADRMQLLKTLKVSGKEEGLDIK